MNTDPGFDLDIQYIYISAATAAQGGPSGYGGTKPGDGGKAIISVKGGDVSDLAVLWLGDSHAKRIFSAIPEKSAAAAGYAWLAIQHGWVEILEDVVGQVADCGGAAKVFVSLGSRLINVSRADHRQVVDYLLEISKKWVGQGFSVTLMELPFGTDHSAHVEIWRANCAIRGINSILLGSSPAAGLLMRSVTTRTDKSARLGLGEDFPMLRDVQNYADLVHLRDVCYLDIWNEVIMEFQKNGFNDPKDPWTVEDGAVTTMVAPSGMLSSWGEYVEGKRLVNEIQLWNPEELFRPPPRIQQQQQQQQQIQQQQQALGNWQPWGNNRHTGGRTRGRGGRRYSGGRGAYGGRPYWARPAADRNTARNNFIFY